MKQDKPTITHFGYQKVAIAEKANKVAQVFQTVANKYDLMNDVMSLGIHRLWKSLTVHLSNVRPGDRVLDLAGGTGDLTARFAKRVGASGEVTLADISENMLAAGRKKLINQGIIGNVNYQLADAQALPFSDDYFDCIVIGFGLRNVTDQNAALRSMLRVLKPGGKAMILEFSKPTAPWLQKIYDTYSFKLIPKLGKWLANDEASYQYLVESIRMHPSQQTLKNMMEQAGFDHCQYHNLSGGIVALHTGYKT
ncbi:MAG: bifunctional demethylmenaquinone methyltransferase/2-methoxy-6-polyprenyl-1,4-benzoquinol methylase UbiE [Gammaproteobacteria bacterium]|nr:bifunctional demethylmenaquinone methyltransferase/2-methoxy-6-polyprenyl-1,4-benzoquinol methylase UbiE [Gammaproteobacteria bacterium]